MDNIYFLMMKAMQTILKIQAIQKNIQSGTDSMLTCHRYTLYPSKPFPP